MPLTICSSQSKRFGARPFIPYYPGHGRPTVITGVGKRGELLFGPRPTMVSPLGALMRSPLHARTELRGPTGGRLDVAVRNMSYTLLQDTEANDINLITVS